MVHHMLGLLDLVRSRVRHDPWRHAAGAAAVGLLVATFLSFNAIALGLHAGVERTIQEERSNQFTTPPNVILSEADVLELAKLPGVQAVHPKMIAQATRSTGFSQIIVVGVNATAEAGLVKDARDAPPAAGGFVSYVSPGPDYLLRAGRWLAGPMEAVVDEGLARDPQAALGQTIELDSPHGPVAFTVVGVVAVQSPANLGMPGTVAGVSDPTGRGVTIVSGPHVIVRIEDHAFVDYTGVRVVALPVHDAIRSVADGMMERYPEWAFDAKSRVQSFERKHFDSVEAVLILSAVGRLTAIAGAGTMFGISLLLLTSEERAIGVLKALGFRRSSLWAYGGAKIGLLILAGALVGALVALVGIRVVPLPDVGFGFEPVITSAVVAASLAASLPPALAGGALGVAAVLLREPAESLRHTE